MQREIKFRAWDAKKKIMLSHSQSTCMSIGNFFEDISEINDGFGRMTLMQYTGLKDKNGKEIFEGDIVQWIHLSEGKVNSQVGFFAGSFQQYPNNRAAYSGSLNAIVLNCEVIGNIYENPGLLTLPSGEKEII